MALQSNTSISINGNEITAYKSLTLKQQIASHHELELICRMDVLEELSGSLADASKNYLGEVITIQITALDNLGSYENLEFKGIVFEVKTVKGHEASEGDYIVITALSPTFLADDGPHYTSYNDVSISEILESTFRYYDQSKLEVLIAPKNNSSLHYSVQHGESAYQYATRLAAQYSEWFYYDGVKLVFGELSTKELELNYGMDLKEYQLRLKPKPHNYNYFTNDYVLNETHQKETRNLTAGANGYSGFVANKANDIYNKTSNVWLSMHQDSKLQQRFDTSAELQKKATEINQVQLTGVSDNPGVALGSIIKIEGGQYRVTKIDHSNNENGDYSNSFEAVTADFDAYPNTNIQAFPRSETQTATVKENNDPEGLTRIRVQFPWQRQLGELTPWIRMVSPYGGAEKGFHFIPEIDEEVLIGFEGGNAELPYVLGSLYNGNAKPENWKTDTNDIKAIRTRSGHTIELNDTDGEEKINIYDNEGSIITFDTQKKSLFISAAENIEFNAKNIKMIAEEQVDIQTKGDINCTSEGDSNFLSKGKTTIQSTGEIEASSNGAISMEAKSSLELKGQSIKAEAKTEATLKGMTTKVEGQITAIQGAGGKLDVM